VDDEARAILVVLFNVSLGRIGIAVVPTERRHLVVGVRAFSDISGVLFGSNLEKTCVSTGTTKNEGIKAGR
jgi:hypothetical protein